MRSLSRSVCATLAAGALIAAVPQERGPHYHVVRRITLGTQGAGYKADFIVIDSTHRRLYGLGNTIVDIDRDSVIDSIPGKAAGGYALAVELGRGLARNGTLFDLVTGKVTGRVAGEGDASVFDPGTGRAFMLDDTVTVVDMRAGTVVLRTHLGTKLESAVTDGRGKLFINREDSAIVLKVDPTTLAIETRYPIANCREPQGLSMDRARRRLFLGCDKELVVVNADNGAVVTRIPVSGHADENGFDAATRLIFNANRTDSSLTIVHEDTPDSYKVVDVVKTGGGARSVAVDPVTHKVYAFYYDQSSGTDRTGWVLMAAVLAP
jgi:DNA-binding beta-propeller fold protein YncE